MDNEQEDHEDNEQRALVAANADSSGIAFINNTLATLSDNQKSILNSQAANRELLGVLIQDNFNLKEENNRLRERILEVERTMAQIRQEEDWRREALRQELDAKLASVQQLATQAITTAHNVEAPDIKTIKSEPGCLGKLLGMSGDTQIVTVPRRRASDSREARHAGFSPVTPPSAAATPPPAFPKPNFPPE